MDGFWCIQTLIEAFRTLKGKVGNNYGLTVGLNVVEIVFGKEPGGGRATGEAYLRFESKGDAERAIQLNGQYMGKR